MVAGVIPGLINLLHKGYEPRNSVVIGPFFFYHVLASPFLRQIARKLTRGPGPGELDIS